ncbi:MbnP family protein [Colwelliaceae bacterium 6471]
MKNKVILFSSIISALVITAIFALMQPSQPNQLTLRFSPFVGKEPLVLHHKNYPNPGGEGIFTVRDLQLFISNIRLIGRDGNYNEAESYHLARFDGDESFYDIVLTNINAQDYQQIELGIGVDPSANGTITIAGDLDPNSRMAWSWDVGYKFLLLEGALLYQEQQLPLVYHIGFNESYTTVTFPISETITSNNRLIKFNVDVLQLFGKAEPIDLSVISTVKFDPDHVALIAKGFNKLITLD